MKPTNIAQSGTEQTARPLVLKVGGALLENKTALQDLFAALTAYLDSAKRPLVLVHGGGCLVENQLTMMQLTSEKKNGLRVTPFEHIPYIAGALAGTANKLLMAQAIAQGMQVVGLSLADAGMCQAQLLDPTLGAVGTCQAGDPALLQYLVSAGYLPIISSIGIDSDGQLLNVNADQAATAICQALDGELIMLSDVAGILDGDGKLIPAVDTAKAQHLMDTGVITDGMVVKVNAALDAANTLQRAIKVASWREPMQLIALFNGEAVGTSISV